MLRYYAQHVYITTKGVDSPEIKIKNFMEELIYGDYELVNKIMGENGVADVESLAVKSRKKGIVIVRYCYWYLWRLHSSLSLKECGEKFNISHHTTVMHGCETASDELHLHEEHNMLSPYADILERPLEKMKNLAYKGLSSDEVLITQYLLDEYHQHSKINKNSKRSTPEFSLADANNKIEIKKKIVSCLRKVKLYRFEFS